MSTPWRRRGASELCCKVPQKPEIRFAGQNKEILQGIACRKQSTKHHNGSEKQSLESQQELYEIDFS